MSEKEEKETCHISTPIDAKGNLQPEQAKIECGLTHINRQTIEWIIDTLDEISTGNTKLKEHLSAMLEPGGLVVTEGSETDPEMMTEDLAKKAKYTALYLKKAFHYKEPKETNVEM